MNKLINKETELIDLGLVDYKEAWDYQEKLFSEIVDLKISNRKKPAEEQIETPNYLIFCEHPPVYTLGKSGLKENLLLDDHGLEEIGASYYKINRGGDITFHGPGQIVCYPIIDLENFFTDIHRYLRNLEESVILTCKEYGLDAGRIDGLTGVWLEYDNEGDQPEGTWDPRKICALGVKSSRWVTMHGLAFNINTNLDFFNHIIPCGIDDKAVTSLSAELQKTIDINEVKSMLKSHIGEIFEMKFTEK